MVALVATMPRNEAMRKPRVASYWRSFLMSSRRRTSQTSPTRSSRSSREKLAPWVQRSFQILRADGFTVEKQASRLDNFVSFRRWQSPDWRRATLALR